MFEELNINTSKLHAHVLPVFWPMLWLNLFLLRQWYAKHGERIGGVSIVTSRCGVIRIEKVFPRTDDNLMCLRLFEDVTDDWCFDQLGLTAEMFARLNAANLCEVGEWLGDLFDLSGFAPAPTINDSS